MRVKQSAGPRVALWLLLCSGISASAWPAPPAPRPKPIAGRAGIVLSHSVVNFSELARRQALQPAKRQEKVEPPERDAPPKILPADAIIKLEPATATAKPNAVQPSAVAAAGFPRQLTAILATGFQAENDLDSNVIPPDTQGTVGPNHLVTTLNSDIVVQNRSGTTLTTVSLDNFWAPTGNSRTTDPRVVYDPYNDRWIISTSGDFLLSTSGVLIGVSQTGDPTGNWNLYKVAVDSTNLHFCDFPTLGFNKTWVVVMCNVFANSSTSTFFAGDIYVFDKFDLYNHGTGAHTVFDNGTGGDSNVTPAITYDNNLATEYMVEEFNGNQNGMGTMRLWAITGSAGSPALSTVAFPATTLTWAENGPNNFGPELSSTTGIDLGDARIGNVIYRNGNLWTTHPVFLPSGTPNRCSVQWWQIDTGGNVLQRGLIDNADGSYFRAYPSIAVNQYNDAVIGYGRFSPNEYPGGFYSFRAGTDPSGTFETEAAVKTGDAPYVRTGSSSSLNRWGDYSNTSVDPADDTSFWTIQEYAFVPNNWATWWGEVVQPPAAFQTTITPSSMTATAGVPVTDVAVTVVDSQGHPVANYRGTVHFTSSDPLFSMPDYTFSASDNGTHHFTNVTLFKAGSQSITLTDAANSIQVTLNFTVVAGPLAALQAVNPGTQTAGFPFSFTVTAQDAFGNTITGYNGTVQFSSGDPAATLPANYTFNPGVDSGTHTFSATLRKAGSQSITARDAANSLQLTLTLTVVPGTLTALGVSGPATAIAGTPFNFSVTAQDPFQNTIAGYNKTVQFSSTDPAATLPGNYTFVAGDSGTHTFNNAILRAAGPLRIFVSDGNISGNLNITITSAAADHLIVSAPANVTRTIPFAVYVTAQDQFNNVASGYRGMVHFSTSDASHTLPADYTFTNGDQGTHNFSGVILNTLGGQTVTATDTATHTITGLASVNVAHMSGAARSLRVRLGKPFDFPLADFTDEANPLPSGPSANIDWGDGASSAGTITGSYTVSGSHAYTSLPERPVTITITDTANGYGPITITVAVRMWPKD